MEQLDYIIILLYFLGLIAVSVVMSRKIKNSEDMFIAGRNSSWWLSGVSSYMTIFSASTFVVWGGVAYKSGLVAVVVALCLGVASFIVGNGSRANGGSYVSNLRESSSPSGSDTAR